jgi:hypothetical protein
VPADFLFIFYLCFFVLVWGSSAAPTGFRLISSSAKAGCHAIQSEQIALWLSMPPS